MFANSKMPTNFKNKIGLSADVKRKSSVQTHSKGSVKTVHGSRTRVLFCTPVFTGRVDGPCSRVVWTGAREHGP